MGWPQRPPPTTTCRNVATYTLPTLPHAGRSEAGYRVGLIYIRPPFAKVSSARFAARGAEGCHGIPEDTLRRFDVSLGYL
ncbi:MAG: hypothetical protein EON58_10340 [Alphaproteobacteria bacterium]|nr:MAG: hypothetical protein EON58_10340 [Alphaproteobacteria bacterium]